MGLHTIIGNKNQAVMTSSEGLEGKTVAIPQEFLMTLSKDLRNIYRYYLLFNSIKQINGKIFMKEALQIAQRSPKQLKRIIEEGNKLFWIDMSSYLIVFNNNRIIKAMNEATKNKQTFMNRLDRSFAYIPFKTIQTLKGFSEVIININAEVENKGRYSKKQQAYISKYKRNGIEGTNRQQNKAMQTIAKQTGYSLGKVCNSLKNHKGKHENFITLALPEKRTPYFKDYKEVLEAQRIISFTDMFAGKTTIPLIKKTKNNNYYLVKRIANTYDPIIKIKTFRSKPVYALYESNTHSEFKAFSKCLSNIIQRFTNHYNLIAQ